MIWLSLMSGAFAFPRTVCFELEFVEDREERVDEPRHDQVGVTRGIDQSKDFDAVGHVIELWDDDSGTSGEDVGGDDLLGTYLITNTGGGCATFDWTQSGDPDVYLKYPNKVRNTWDTSVNVSVQGLKPNGAKPVVSFINHVYENCPLGTYCWLNGGNPLVPFADKTVSGARRIMALDSAQRSLDAFDSVFVDTEMKLSFYPQSSTNCGSSTGQAHSRTEFAICEAGANRPGTPPHEVGHLLMEQLFGRDGLAIDCSLGGDSHGMTSIEYESCATAEGWADFVAAASWYNPDAAGVTPWVKRSDFEEKDPVESVCSDNKGIELQVARGFWDLADSNNEAASAPATYADGYNSNRKYIALGWAEFATGTGNRDDFESDRDGPNLRDYYENNISRFGTGFFTTLLNHNCTQGQDDN